MQRYHFADKGPYSQAMVFSVVMYEYESWTIKQAECQKNWCFRIVVLEKTLESPLDCKEIQPVHPKGNQPWIFIGRTGAEAEISILWPPDARSWLIGKDPDAQKDCKCKRRRGWQRLRWLDASPTQWTWIWANSGKQWRTGKPGILQFMGLQRVGYNLVTEQQYNLRACRVVSGGIILLFQQWSHCQDDHGFLQDPQGWKPWGNLPLYATVTAYLGTSWAGTHLHILLTNLEPESRHL